MDCYCVRDTSKHIYQYKNMYSLGVSVRFLYKNIDSVCNTAKYRYLYADQNSDHDFYCRVHSYTHAYGS